MDLDEVRNNQFWSLVEAIKRIERLEEEIEELKKSKPRGRPRKVKEDGNQ